MEEYDFNIGDEVFLYRTPLIKRSIQINKGKFGTILDITKDEMEDMFGSERIKYDLKIKLNSGKIIILRDALVPSPFDMSIIPASEVKNKEIYTFD